MTIHLCSLDRDCRAVDAPPRLYANAFGRNVVVALWPSAKVQDRNGRWRWFTSWKVARP